MKELPSKITLSKWNNGKILVAQRTKNDNYTC